LQGGFGDLFRRLMQPGVDDFKAMVAQGSRNGLCTPIVAVETRFGDNDAIGPLHKEKSLCLGAPSTVDEA
jgi:hypothetical protein